MRDLPESFVSLLMFLWAVLAVASLLTQSMGFVIAHLAVMILIGMITLCTTD